MPDHYVYIHAEVFGIQKFIFATGKLKEMIGGSEIIEDFSKGFYEKTCDELALKEVEKPSETEGWILPIQRNAGMIKAVVKNKETAKRFLGVLSKELLTQVDGLPFCGCCVEVQWTQKGLSEARLEASNKITAKFNSAPPQLGLSLLPMLQTAKLDGLPAVGNEDRENISLLSRAKRSRRYLAKSDERLKDTYEDIVKDVLTDEVDYQWTNNLEELASNEYKIALIHIDGNDLGKMFSAEIEKQKEASSPEVGISNMKYLSEVVNAANEKAFGQGLVAALAKVKTSPERLFTIPIRPLVMGGDDVTVVVRADLALAFIDAYVAEFERYTAEKSRRLSVGVGMVVSSKSYPFSKAFCLAEDLLSSAKRSTIKYTENRPSSLDYVVLTSDVETDLSALRHRLFFTHDKKHCLTSKPLVLQEGALGDFIACGEQVLNQLPRGGARAAANACRISREQGDREFQRLLDNMKHELGGRHDEEQMNAEEFKKIFSEDSFFVPSEHAEALCTPLLDYLELRHLLEGQ